MARPWYREPWPWALAAGPGSVVIAGIVTMAIAAKSNDGVVADDYYKQGLTINESMARDDAARRLGLSGSVAFSAGRARIVLHSPGAALPQSLALRLVHPTRSGEDAAATLVAISPGVYEGPVRRAGDGRRTVVVEDAARTWRLKAEIDSPAESVLLGS